MASSLDDHNPDHSSCLYTHCPGFVVSHFQRSYFSAHMGGTITCHDYSSVNFLILSIWFPPSLFTSSLPLRRWLRFAIYFPGCLCSSHSLWSLLPQGLPGALRVGGCKPASQRLRLAPQALPTRRQRTALSLQKSPIKRAGFSVFLPVFCPGWRHADACSATRPPRHQLPYNMAAPTAHSHRRHRGSVRHS